MSEPVHGEVPALHGWRREGATKSLNVGALPGRSNPVLYAAEGDAITVLAVFKGPLEALVAVALVDALVGAEPAIEGA